MTERYILELLRNQNEEKPILRESNPNADLEKNRQE
jgi:hypothetical protein